MKSMNCLWLALLYTFAGIGLATFKAEGHYIAVRLAASFASGFCFGAAPLMVMLTAIYFVFPGKCQEEEEQEDC